MRRIFSRKAKIKENVEKWEKEHRKQSLPQPVKVDCSPTVSLTSLADSSIVITIKAWTRSEFYWPVLYDINEKIYKEYPLNGLSFPFPQMDVHVTKAE